MQFLSYRPRPPLADFVDKLWLSVEELAFRPASKLPMIIRGFSPGFKPRG